MNLNINKFELLSFIRGHAFGSHLSQGIWRRCVNEFYGKLDDGERNFVWHFVMAHIISDIVKWKDDPIAKKDILQFVNRFDPDNQFVVQVKDEYGGGTFHAFLSTYRVHFEGEPEPRIVSNYHVMMDRFIPDYKITAIAPDEERAKRYHQNYDGRFDCKDVEKAKIRIREMNNPEATREELITAQKFYSEYVEWVKGLDPDKDNEGRNADL